MPLPVVKLNGRFLSVLSPTSPSLSAPSGPKGFPDRVRRSAQVRDLSLAASSRPDRLPDEFATDGTRPPPRPRPSSDSPARVQDAPIAKMEASSPIFPDREVARRPSDRTNSEFSVTRAADLELWPKRAVPVPATDADVKSRADTPPRDNRKERPNGSARSTGKYTTIVWRSKDTRGQKDDDVSVAPRLPAMPANPESPERELLYQPPLALPRPPPSNKACSTDWPPPRAVDAELPGPPSSSLVWHGCFLLDFDSGSTPGCKRHSGVSDNGVQDDVEIDQGIL